MQLYHLAQQFYIIHIYVSVSHVAAKHKVDHYVKVETQIYRLSKKVIVNKLLSCLQHVVLGSEKSVILNKIITP